MRSCLLVLVNIFRFCFTMFRLGSYRGYFLAIPEHPQIGETCGKECEIAILIPFRYLGNKAAFDHVNILLIVHGTLHNMKTPNAHETHATLKHHFWGCFIASKQCKGDSTPCFCLLTIQGCAYCTSTVVSSEIITLKKKIFNIVCNLHYTHFWKRQFYCYNV